jgi:3-oxoacyl-[acyl-carrier protein] reductase
MSERPVAIVTGGSAGIGATICRRMIDAGYEVVSLARRKPDWSHAALHAVEVDLTDARATEQAAGGLPSNTPSAAWSTMPASSGRISCADVSQEDLHELTQLHLGAAILLRAGGVAGHARAKIRPHRADLVARGARAADAHRLFGDQGGHDRHGAHLGARACAVRHHGECRGAGPDRRYRDVSEVIPAGSEREAALAKAIPVGRLGRSDDVARAVMFFADPENSFITGQLLYVCGGASVASFSL